MSEVKQVTYLLMRGMPGSGKSTLARQMLITFRGSWKRLNKDTLREMLDLDDWSPENEQMLNQLMNKMAAFYLSRGWNVVSDNMNLDPVHVKTAVKLATRISETPINEAAPVAVTVKTHDIYIDKDVCVERDSKRPKPVGADVIAKIYDKWYKDGMMRDVSKILAKQPHPL